MLRSSEMESPITYCFLRGMWPVDYSVVVDRKSHLPVLGRASGRDRLTSCGGDAWVGQSEDEDEDEGSRKMDVRE